MWGIVSLTQIWLALKLMSEFEGYLSVFLGTTGAAGVMVAMYLFREESREMLLNPLKHMQKEVHPEQQKAQGKGVWTGVFIWFVTIIFGTFAL